MVRDGKPKGFFYLGHRTVDGMHAIITDTHVTAGNVNDSIPYLSRLDEQCEKFGFEPKAVGLDAGYMTNGICKGLHDREVQGVIGYRRPNSRPGFFYKRQYEYLSSIDGYRCPGGQVLKYSTTNREGYREYKSDAKICQCCLFLDQCTSSANQVKVVTRHVWQDIRDKTDKNRLTPWGKAIYKRRKETVEHSFADAK